LQLILTQFGVVSVKTDGKFFCACFFGSEGKKYQENRITEHEVALGY